MGSTHVGLKKYQFFLFSPHTVHLALAYHTILVFWSSDRNCDVLGLLSLNVSCKVHEKYLGEEHAAP